MLVQKGALSSSSKRKVGRKKKPKHFTGTGQDWGCLERFQVIPIRCSKSAGIHQGDCLCKAELSVMGSPEPFMDYRLKMLICLLFFFPIWILVIIEATFVYFEWSVICSYSSASYKHSLKYWLVLPVSDITSVICLFDCHCLSYA